MSNGDYSRQTFDPRKNYVGVLMQQGRVQLDADWNEFVAILDRRLRVHAIDTLGTCVVPSETPAGFEIKHKTPAQSAAGGYTIGAGRAYIHGLLAENHGYEGKHALDSKQSKGGALHPVPYDDQPYPPEPAPLPAAPFVFYLDVWEREVTCLEYPDLV